MTAFPLVIAEAGVNHNGDESLAHRLIDEAAAAGAHVVKFQTFKTEKLASADAPKCDYQLETTDRGESQFAMLKRLELATEAYPRLMAHCADRGIEFMSTPFDEESADFLVGLGMKRVKLPSGEVTNVPLLRHAARLGRPVLLSTGMSDLDEVVFATCALQAAGCADLTLLHCLTNYPAPVAETNLHAMAIMAAATGLPIGYSDHTEGITVSLAAVALGAVVIEKHFTLDRSMEGPDHKASLEPDELKALVEGCRVVALSLGHGRKEPAPSERETRLVVRRSLTLAHNAGAGTELTADLLIARRPAGGISPAAIDRVIGRRLKSAVAAGAVLTEDMLA